MAFFYYNNIGDYMEIIVGKYSGFCNGVKNAISKTIESLKNDNFYSVGEIVHNEEVINDLNKRGLIVRDSIKSIPNNAKVIVRAHGETLDFYREAKKMNLDIVDLTCGRVKLVHNKILSKKNSFIIIIGKKNHPETIAHQSYSDNSYIVEDVNDINGAYDSFLTSGKDDLYIVVQTTFNENLFNEIVCEIKKRFNKVNISVDNTICNASSIRQSEVRDIASRVDKMVIIGGKNSSNTKELAIESSKYCKVVYLIQNEDDLDESMFNVDDVVGVSAGASTPDESIKKVINMLSGLYKKTK